MHLDHKFEFIATFKINRNSLRLIESKELSNCVYVIEGQRNKFKILKEYAVIRLRSERHVIRIPNFD